MNSKNKKLVKQNISETYNKFKEFEGKPYTGVKIGRGHHWIYDQGEWKEKKLTPDKWEISFAVKKRRKGRAPEGSGVPVGTKYHWYILAHQIVQKLNANDYSTEMVGMKYKIAHQRANKKDWNITDTAQKKRLLKVLHELSNHLEDELNLVNTSVATKKILNKDLEAANEPYYSERKTKKRKK